VFFCIEYISNPSISEYDWARYKYHANNSVSVEVLSENEICLSSIIVYLNATSGTVSPYTIIIIIIITHFKQDPKTSYVRENFSHNDVVYSVAFISNGIASFDSVGRRHECCNLWTIFR
jgi:hypothetical protein